jgi:hypothetical protein
LPQIVIAAESQLSPSMEPLGAASSDGVRTCCQEHEPAVRNLFDPHQIPGREDRTTRGIPSPPAVTSHRARKAAVPDDQMNSTAALL